MSPYTMKRRRIEGSFRNNNSGLDKSDVPSVNGWGSKDGLPESSWVGLGTQSWHKRLDHISSVQKVLDSMFFFQELDRCHWRA
jgi:hypothetical protein